MNSAISEYGLSFKPGNTGIIRASIQYEEREMEKSISTFQRFVNRKYLKYCQNDFVKTMRNGSNKS